MGELLRAHCPCGYEQEKISVGGGIIAKPSIVAWCAGCKRHVSVSERRRKCRECGGDVEPLGREEDGWLDVGSKYRCEMCGNDSLSFDIIAFWD